MLFLDQEKMAYSILKMLNLSENRLWLEGMAKGASALGAALDVFGLHGIARNYHARALESGKASGNLAAQGMISNFFGLHRAHAGDWDGALHDLASAHELSVRTGDMLTGVACGVYRSMLLIDRCAFAEALSFGRDMVKQGEEAAFDMAVRSGLMVQGKTLWRLGAVNEARPLLEEALRRGIASADVVHATDAWGELGLSLCEAGNIDAAAEQLAQAESLVRRHKVRTFTIVPILLGLAQVEVVRLERKSKGCDADTAMRRCRNAVSIGRCFYFGLPRALRTMGTLYWLTGRQRRAERWWQESLEAALRVEARYEIALTRLEIGNRKNLASEWRLGEELLAQCRAAR
jgi:tetratricopeptide (TPR) repeat protein